MSNPSPVRFLVLCLFVAGMTSALAGHLPEPEMGQEFVERLLARETRSDALYELILSLEKQNPRGKNILQRVFDYAIGDIRVTECPGRGGTPPLYLVTYKEDFRTWFAAAHSENQMIIGDFEAGYVYPQIKEEQRAGEHSKSVKGQSRLSNATIDEPFLPPSLKNKVLYFIDADGRVQWPHGGDNDGGKSSVIADLTGDGVFERLDHGNYGFDTKRDERTTFQVLRVRTIEATPRLLLAVVFNWHPEDADDANRWWYEMRDPQDGSLPVIVLGPQPGKNEGEPIKSPAIEYHWDSGAMRYVGPDGRHGDHFRRLAVTNPDEVWPAIKEVRKEQSLGYPLLTEAPPEIPELEKKDESPAPDEWLTWPKYEHHTLAAMNNEELFHWQYGGEPKPNQTPDPEPPMVVPPKLGELAPKDAAIALAEANRTRAHRKRYELVMGDGAEAPPKEGVLVLEVNPGAGPTYQEFIRLDGQSAEWWKCTLLIAKMDPIWFRQPDTDGTLRWLADVIWWLDKVRTVPLVAESVEPAQFVSWTHTTRAGLLLQLQDNDSEEFNFRSTEVRHIGRQWNGPYTRLVAQSLAVNLWMRLRPPWDDAEDANISVEEAVSTLLPQKIRTFTVAERLIIQPAIVSAGHAGLNQFRPQLELLAEGDGTGSDKTQTVPAPLAPLAGTAISEIDHRDDAEFLKPWASDYHRPGNAWARMRLREIEAKAIRAAPKKLQPKPRPRETHKKPKIAPTWDQLAEQYLATLAKGFPDNELVQLLKFKDDHREELWEVMKRKFDGARGRFQSEIAAVYAAGLRDVAQNDLAHLATASPDEVEGTRYDYWVGGNDRNPVDGRFHLARHILAVWQEPDPLTRAKLLLLLGLKSSDSRSRLHGWFADQVARDLNAATASLSDEDRAALREFAQWCATDAVGRMDDYPFTEAQAEWLKGIMAGETRIKKEPLPNP